MLNQRNRGRLWLTLLLLGCVWTTLANDITDLEGDPNCRRENIHSGNKVRTIFYNYGLVANVNEPSFEWPIGTGNEYVGDISILVGVEYYDEIADTTVISVVHSDNPGHHPLDSDPENPAIFWGFEPLCGFAAPDTSVAMSHQPWTWPSVWPDKGWPGSWNGFFGRDVMNADQESYFIMDDARDMEFIDWIIPFPDDTMRGGLGIQVKCRGFQWSHVLAEDAIIWLYEITNVGEINYDKVAFGMICGTLVGGRNDSQDDMSRFDIDNDFTYSWDADSSGQYGWVGDVGYVGYAFLESPGNPYDGIDNDNDSDDPASPQFTESIITNMLSAHELMEGEEVIVIDYDNGAFERSLDTLGTDTLEIVYRDTVFQYFSGMTLYEDTLDLIDNNLNGLIDERFSFIDPETGEGMRYIDYFDRLHGGHVDPLIDERRDDGIDNDGDWNSQTDDVGADGMAYSGDFGEGDGIPTAGEPHFDQTDITESDQIGLTSFDYFLTNELALRHDLLCWSMLEPGHFDEIEDPEGDGEDGDFIYGSGFFPLRAGESRFFSLAVLFGENYDDLLNNKITVQQIYDENYNFSKPPDKPRLSAAPGDGRVILYWDNRAESSYDVVSGFDFEGYKIYRATDPGFNEVYNITDGYGNAQFSEPLRTYDLIDGIHGFFPLAINGVQFHLGDETGLQHVWIDSTINNGQRYFYAVTAYDHGDAERFIYPAETSKYALIDAAGNITTDVNTVVVTPSEPAAGYQPPTIYPEATHIAGVGTGSIELELIDPTAVRDGVTYLALLGDTLVAEPDTASNDSIWHEAGYMSVRDQLQEPIEELLIYVYPVPEPPGDTLYLYNLVYDGIWPDSFSLFAPDGGELTPGEDYELDYAGGVIFFLRGNSLADGAQLTAVYNYDYPFRHIYDRENNLTPVVDGVRLIVHNDWLTRLRHDESGWSDTTSNLPDWVFELCNIRQGFVYLTGQRNPADYQVVFADDSISQSILFDWSSFHYDPHPLNFEVTNLSTDEPIDVIFSPAVDRVPGPQLQPGDIVIFAEQDTITWDFWLSGADTLARLPGAGDELLFILEKSFGKDDIFEYTNYAATVDRNQAARELDRVKVVPNPYLAAATWESRPLVSGGRGERKIQFIHLPAECTIRIYTVRGELVKRLEHNGGVADGSLDWNLKSRDGLDIAYGIYVYHLEADVGEKIGKFAIIK